MIYFWSRALSVEVVYDLKERRESKLECFGDTPQRINRGIGLTALNLADE